MKTEFGKLRETEGILVLYKLHKNSTSHELIVVNKFYKTAMGYYGDEEGLNEMAIGLNEMEFIVKYLKEHNARENEIYLPISIYDGNETKEELKEMYEIYELNRYILNKEG